MEGRTGYVVEPGNVDQLADAIHGLWTDRPAYQRVSRHTRELVIRKFDRKNQLDRFLEYFRTCAGSRVRSSIR